MTPDFVEALEARVAELSTFAEIVRVIAASTELDSDATDVLGLIHRELVRIANRADDLVAPARGMLP